MDEKQMKALAEKMAGQTAEQITKSLAKFAEDNGLNGVADMKSTLQKISENETDLKSLFGDKKGSEFIGNMQKQLDDMATTIKTNKLLEQKNSKGSVKEMIAKSLDENIDKLQAVLEGKSKSATFDIKAAGDMSLSGNVTGDIPQAERDAGVTLQSRNMPSILPLTNRRPITSNTADWVEQVARDGGAAMTAEGATYSKADFDLEKGSMGVKKVTVLERYTDEMAEDIAGIRSIVTEDMTSHLNVEIDDQIRAGDNTGQNLKGITNYAQTFAAGGLADKIESANDYDVAVAGKLQVRTNKIMKALKERARATHMIVSPTKLAEMMLTKDANNNYLVVPFSGSLTIAGLILVEDDSIADDTFIVADMTLSNVRIKNGSYKLEFADHAGDDFKDGYRSVRLSARLCHYIKANHVGAFVTGSFTTAKAALETP